tara:strand:- start:73 stop:270 length:198 start_codon:yes stop_codon:yes gene_type:complete
LSARIIRVRGQTKITTTGTTNRVGPTLAKVDDSVSGITDETLNELRACEVGAGSDKYFHEALLRT